MDPMESINVESHIENEAYLQAVLFSSSAVLSMVLKAALELELFDIIARAGPGSQLSPSDIATQLPAQNPETPSRLDRVLRLLASHSVLTCTLRTFGDGRVERLYGLAPPCKFFLNRENEGSLVSMSALSSHRATVEVWANVKDAILESGNIFERIHGMSVFKYLDIDPTFKKYFNQAMADVTIIVMNQILKVYKGFEGLSSLVDVGGGIGKTLSMVVSKYPSIKGINFDLPYVVQINAPSYPGIEHVGGSMFESIPEAEAIMIKDTLHNWSDEDCIKILKKCHKVVVSNGGKVIIITVIMPEAADTSLASKYAALLDNTMLMNPGGQERTEKEFEALCMGSGFSGSRVVCRAFNLWAVIELYK